MDIPVYTARTLVIGSGCAGLNAADWLHDLGEDVCLATEGMHMGTSRNTGSDKQTYYKLSLSAAVADSIDALARSLLSEGMHGESALVQAACSVQCFFKLVQLGVPFPFNEYGEFVGYQTDHASVPRATSAGPLTSKMMTECLQREVERKQIPVLDGCTAFHLITGADGVQGVLLFDQAKAQVIAVRCAHVILATGGPAHVYAQRVYPESQTGMSALAIAAGARCANLQHWQYGLASLGFRWNVSGTYQQVLPRFVSVDARGQEHEFLPDYFKSPWDAVNRCFQKGYQWPFSVANVPGSSLIDLIVHHERQALGRRVFMDFRRNPSCLDASWEGLSQEARDYLNTSGAAQPLPIGRLSHMNQPAIDLYCAHGIDLHRDMLEVAVCAQHHNGGIDVDAHWHSSIPGLYTVGEAAGTFGVHRPGGSALNAAQVGAMRAAQHIAYDSARAIPPLSQADAGAALKTALRALGFPNGEISHIAQTAQVEMTACAAHIRDPEAMRRLLSRVEGWLAEGEQAVAAIIRTDFPARIKLRDQLITQRAVLEAMLAAAEAFGSQGAGMVSGPNGTQVWPTLPYAMDAAKPQAQSLVTISERCHTEFCPARPLPQGEHWFETAWKAYGQRTAPNQMGQCAIEGVEP